MSRCQQFSRHSLAHILDLTLAPRSALEPHWEVLACSYHPNICPLGPGKSLLHSSHVF